MTDYSLDCQCGRTIALKISQAGSMVSCSCGRENQVPPMSQLRRAAGETPMPLTIAEQIQQQIQQGKLPTSGQCAYSGTPTDETHLFHIQCERPWVTSGPMGERTSLVLSLLFGWIGVALALGGMKRKSVEHGRETSLTVPLRIDAHYADAIDRYSQRKLRDLLSTEPLYRQLFEEYPEAIVSLRGQTRSPKWAE